MASHSSATSREETPHVNGTSRTNNTIHALRQRAESVVNDKSIDPQTRAIIRYAMEIHDPWLARLVRRVDAGEKILDSLDFSQTSEPDEDDSYKEKFEALAEMICRADNESAAALLVLMAMLENATDAKALANTAKHLAFTRCGELNLYGMIDAQVAVLEGELLS